MTRANGGAGGGTGSIRAAVIGGSLGGLAAGLALHEVGCDVDIFERVAEELRGRGAGIVAQPELLSFFEVRGISTREELGVPSEETRYLRRDGSVEHSGEKHHLMTSWGILYHHLRSAYPDERYHQDSKLVSFEQDESGVVAHFEGGGEEACDLLMGADGIDSTYRNKGLVFEGEDQPLSAYLDRWLNGSARGSVKPSTFEGYERMIRNHIKPALGYKKLKVLAPDHVQYFYQAKLDAGLAPGTVRMMHGILHRALEQAVKWGDVPRNVCKATTPPRPNPEEIRPLDAE